MRQLNQVDIHWLVISSKWLLDESRIITHHPVQEYVITDVRENMPMGKARDEGQRHVSVLGTNVTWKVTTRAKEENNMVTAYCLLQAYLQETVETCPSY